ncbi:MAG: sugar-binding protein, partial [Oscillospiraceae bacterium]
KESFKMSNEQELNYNEIIDKIDDIYNIGDEILNSTNEKEIKTIDASKALYQLYGISETWAELLQVSDGIKKLPELKSDKIVKEVSDYADIKYKNSDLSMKYSDEILRYARRYNKKANDLIKLEENPAKDGIVFSWDLLSQKLCGWFTKFSEFEMAENIDYIVTWPLAERNTYLDENKKFKFSVENRGDKSFNGMIEILDENGEIITRSENFTVSAGQEGEIIAYKDLRMSTPEKRLTINLIENGKIVKQETGVIHNRDIAKMTMLPVDDGVENLKKVDILVENLFDVPQTVNLEMKSNDISFAGGKQKITLDGKEKKTISVPISSVLRSSYNHYVVDMKLKNENGNVIAHNNQPLSFTLITKTATPIDVKNFDGNIESFSDAYPVYINPPMYSDTKAVWDDKKFKARAMLKWDENNLYVLVDVYDYKQLQEATGSDIWNGDSVQVAIDRKGDKAKSYKDDDYELGVALSNVGVINYVWNPAREAGVINKQFANIIRNNESNLTRYLMAIPRTSLNPLEFKDNNKVGLNIAVNDANVLSRDAWYEFSLGLASTKDPSKWSDFTMKALEENVDIKNKNTAELFVIDMKSNNGGTQ